MKENLLVSVVTVVYNGERCIEKTILSVLNQFFSSFEYIVVDGLSTDSTVEIIKRHASSLAACISEKDEGLYFAMNKAIDLCHGDYILFLNCGDLFDDNNVLNSFYEHYNSLLIKPDVFFGDSVYDNPYGRTIVKPGSLNDLGRKMVFSHQSCFVKRSILINNKFNTKYWYAADYELLSRLYLKGFIFSYINRRIARLEIGDGVSFHNATSSLKEHYGILKLRRVPGASRWFLKVLITNKLVFLCKFITPHFIIQPVLRYLHRSTLINN